METEKGICTHTHQFHTMIKSGGDIWTFKSIFDFSVAGLCLG